MLCGAGLKGAAGSGTTGDVSTAAGGAESEERSEPLDRSRLGLCRRSSHAQNEQLTKQTLFIKDRQNHPRLTYKPSTRSGDTPTPDIYQHHQNIIPEQAMITFINMTEIINWYWYSY
ncbi:hypothetical protein JCM17823_00860 [Halorubrum gandharaense]